MSQDVNITRVVFKVDRCIGLEKDAEVVAAKGQSGFYLRWNCFRLNSTKGFGIRSERLWWTIDLDEWVFNWSFEFEKDLIKLCNLGVRGEIELRGEGWSSKYRLGSDERI